MKENFNNIKILNSSPDINYYYLQYDFSRTLFFCIYHENFNATIKNGINNKTSKKLKNQNAKIHKRAFVYVYIHRTYTRCLNNEKKRKTLTYWNNQTSIFFDVSVRNEKIGKERRRVNISYSAEYCIGLPHADDSM